MRRGDLEVVDFSVPLCLARSLETFWAVRGGGGGLVSEWNIEIFQSLEHVEKNQNNQAVFLDRVRVDDKIIVLDASTRAGYILIIF